MFYSGPPPTKGMAPGKHKLFITNIPNKVGRHLIYELLAQVSKIEHLHYDQSRGYCFVSYETPEELEYTYNVLQGVRVYGKRLYLSRVEDESRVTVRGIGEEIDEAFLWDVFSKFGPCSVEIDDKVGIITYRRRDCAIKAIRAISGKTIGDSEVVVEMQKSDK